MRLSAHSTLAVTALCGVTRIERETVDLTPVSGHRRAYDASSVPWNGIKKAEIVKEMHRAGLFSILLLHHLEQASQTQQNVYYIISYHALLPPQSYAHCPWPGMLPAHWCTVPANGPGRQSPKEITKKIKGKEYTLKPLSANEQGENSETYQLVGGWKGKADQPAIVKIIKAADKTKVEYAKSELKILEKKDVDQLYASDKEKLGTDGYTYTFVLKDLHKNYPSKGDPELAPLYEILEENPSLDVADSVAKVKRMAIKKAEELADSDKFVYRDIQPLNIWTDRKLSVVYFIDYGFPSIVDVSSGLFKGGSGQAAIKKANAIKQMKENADNHYTLAKVKAKMGKKTTEEGGEQSEQGGKDDDGKGKGKDEGEDKGKGKDEGEDKGKGKDDGDDKKKKDTDDGDKSTTNA
ncbi:hypothetical protein BDZ89DRAFT_1144430 [Hymenopellis radicata]|nr:hypothetical protein BDZ89DRAFT_1144430 [Hymenopellis radicata]